MPPNHIIKAYAFTEADKQHLTDLLAKSYLLAKTQAYNRAISRTKHVVTIRKPWQPGESDVESAQKWATTQVDGIAETYETLLQHAIEQMAEQPHEAIGDVIGKVKDVVGKIGDWFKGFLPWKTQQVADQTWNEGDNDGTEQFIDEVQDDKNVDEVVSGGRSMLRVVILPANSSSDFCSDYAGQSFSLNDNIPEFPAHVGCIHYREMTIFDENESVRRSGIVESSESITLFLDIDGVFNMDNADLPTEMIGDREAHPIPQASTILQALDQDDRFNPVWVSHWGKDSNLWNYRANIWRWIACFPLADSDSVSKPFAMQHYLDLIDGHGGIWVQDGFADDERQWAVENGVKLVDTTEEPVRSLLLSDSVDAARELIDMLVGSEAGMSHYAN
jgi:hypothetical protein